MIIACFLSYFYAGTLQERINLYLRQSTKAEKIPIKSKENNYPSAHNNKYNSNYNSNLGIYNYKSKFAATHNYVPSVGKKNSHLGPQDYYDDEDGDGDGFGGGDYYDHHNLWGMEEGDENDEDEDGEENDEEDTIHSDMNSHSQFMYSYEKSINRANKKKNDAYAALMSGMYSVKNQSTTSQKKSESVFIDISMDNEDVAVVKNTTSNTTSIPIPNSIANTSIVPLLASSLPTTSISEGQQPQPQQGQESSSQSSVEILSFPPSTSIPTSHPPSFPATVPPSYPSLHPSFPPPSASHTRPSRRQFVPLTLLTQSPLDNPKPLTDGDGDMLIKYMQVIVTKVRYSAAKYSSIQFPYFRVYFHL